MYFLFYVLITKLNLKTPGREDDDNAAEMNIELGSSDYAAMAAAILEGVGGAANVTNVDNCITRLRLEVKDRLLVDEKKFMVGIVSRLTDQKGLDLIQCVMDEMCSDDMQLVVLGTGDERYENMFRHFAWKYQGKVSANIFYSEAMSHKIYGSCDAFLMPSQFEPCGLSQLMSLRYGTVPIVRETGGLKDTVQPYNEFENTGDGFSFANYNAHEMKDAVERAVRVYREEPEAWTGLVRSAMAADFGFEHSAEDYARLYIDIL